MSFTSTTNYALQKIGIGTEIDAWGDDVNTNMDLIDTRMKLNADAAASKAPLVHVHAGADITTGTLAAARLPAFTGDVTSAIGTAVNVIAAAAVTNAKLATMAANTIKGSVGGGTPADLTSGQILAVSGAAPLASPAFTGVPTTATTPTAGDNTTKLATTAFVTAAVAAGATGGAILNKTASYALVLTDAGDLIEMNVAGANTVTVPLNSTQAFPTGTRIDVVQMGAGQTTITPTGGVTLKASGSKLKLTAQYSGATLMKRGTDDWYVWGDLSA